MKSPTAIAIVGLGVVGGGLSPSAYSQSRPDAADSLMTKEAGSLIESVEEAAAAVRAAEEAGPADHEDSVRRRRRIRFEMAQQISRRLDLGRGFARVDSAVTRYAGSPVRALATMEMRVGKHIAMRLAAEKDAGERFGGNLTSVDFLTAGVTASGMGLLTSATVGDYVAHWGWGLIVGRPTFGFGPRPRRPRSRGVTAYRGLNESDFLRGIAVSLGAAGRWSFSAFVSRRRMDATADTAGVGGTIYRLSSADGLHRTPVEKSRKGLLTMESAGGWALVRAGPVQVGVGGYALEFDHPLTAGVRPDEAQDFSGSSQWGVSSFLSLGTRSTQSSAELAIVDGRWAGLVAGTVLTTSRAWATWVYYRQVEARTQSLLGSIPQRRSDGPAEERGVTFGIRHRIASGMTIGVAYDTWSFDGLRFGLQTPSDGRDLSISAIAKGVRSELELRTSIRESHRATSVVTESGIHLRTNVLTRAWRSSIHSRTHLRKNIELDVRYTSVVAGGRSGHLESGQLLAFDVRLAIQERVEVKVRLALFGTDSGNSRVFSYESGLSRDFSIPSFSGRGERRYVVVRMTPRDFMMVRFKYARTRWPGKTSAGSGLDATQGDTIRSVGLEVAVKV